MEQQIEFPFSYAEKMEKAGFSLAKKQAKSKVNSGIKELGKSRRKSN